jgi:hypothetical protein
MSDDSQGTRDERDTIFEFEDALSEAISAAGAGEFDGNDFGGGECTLYMYGPDADQLFAAIRPVIDAHPGLVRGGHAVLRYGPPEDGIREVKIPFPSA